MTTTHAHKVGLAERDDGLEEHPPRLLLQRGDALLHRRLRRRPLFERLGGARVRETGEGRAPFLLEAGTGLYGVDRQTDRQTEYDSR